MKNENKCFFSISLENGITITGENPNEVKEFLMDIFTAFNDCKIISKKQGYIYFAKKINEIGRQALDAAYTITKNYKLKSEEK